MTGDDDTKDANDDGSVDGGAYVVLHNIWYRKNKWEISHSRWEISREGLGKKIDLETEVA